MNVLIRNTTPDPDVNHKIFGQYLHGISYKYVAGLRDSCEFTQRAHIMKTYGHAHTVVWS